MRKTILTLLLAGALSAGCALAQDSRHFPAPSTVSAPMAESVSAAQGPLWLARPSTAEDWNKLTGPYTEASGKNAVAAAQAADVTVTEGRIAGVPVFTLTPPAVDNEKNDKVIYYIHGGGYVLGHGIGGIYEAIPLAGDYHYRVVSVDYRMAPQDPFPAAIDDAFAVYKELVKTYGADNIAVYGTSTGGAMTLILGIQAAQAGVEQPAALIAGTPWADLGKVGDSYAVNENVDNILGTYDGLIDVAAKAYANGADYKNPLISPVYAQDKDLKKFPPTLLIAGTRDLFLSNTVRMHKRLLLDDVQAELVVYEALSHAQYYLNPKAPETGEHYAILDKFLKRTLLD